MWNITLLINADITYLITPLVIDGLFILLMSFHVVVLLAASQSSCDITAYIIRPPEKLELSSAYIIGSWAGVFAGKLILIMCFVGSHDFITTASRSNYKYSTIHLFLGSHTN